MDYNTLEKLGKAVLYGNILASIHTPAQTKVQFDTALEMYKKYVGNVYNDTLPAPADVGAVEGDRCLLNVNNDYEAYEVVDGVWKKYTTKDGAPTEADLTDYYTKPEVREYVNDLIKNFISKNSDNTLSGSNTFTKPIIGDLSGNANTATKATKDSEGNVIKDTYATKTECESKASLDATQMLAVNSGITASKVAEYEAMKTSKVNEADIKPVAKTGSYSDLLNKPTINDSTINIKVNGVSIGTFTTNSANAKDIAITIPTKMSDLDNDSDYVASTTLHDYAKLTEVENKISDLVSSAPETLDTLNELASALGNDPNFATTVANQIGTKANASDLTTHTSDSNIHVTTSDKAKWNAKQDALSAQQIQNIADVTNKANSSDLNNYLPLNGGVMSGDLRGNGSNNLGTSTNKWKTINGLNPGALSLPGTSYINVDTTGWDLTCQNGQLGSFTPNADGWLMLQVGNSGTSEIDFWVIGGVFRINSKSTINFADNNNFNMISIPVEKDVTYRIYGNASEYIAGRRITYCRFMPCQGNV